MRNITFALIMGLMTFPGLSFGVVVTHCYDSHQCQTLYQAEHEFMQAEEKFKRAEQKFNQARRELSQAKGKLGQVRNELDTINWELNRFSQIGRTLQIP